MQRSTVFDQGIVQALMGDAVGVLPTDTLYGVVCNAARPVAVARLYELKNREHKPGTVIAANLSQLEHLGIKADYLTPVAHFWPGAVSVVVSSDPKLAYLDQGVGSLAVRIPDNPELIGLLLQTGPLLTSSANLPGEQPAATIAHARHYFGDTVDFYVDGGDLSKSAPSTVVQIIDNRVEVLRHGAVKINNKGEKR